MRLLPWEEDRILVFAAAELARRTRDAGLRLNHPEAVALICDAMHGAARAGGSYDAVVAAGRGAVREDEVIEGVRALLDEVRLEVLLDDGTRLVVLEDPLGPVDPLAGGRPEPAEGAAGARADRGPVPAPARTSVSGVRMRPGEVRLGEGEVELAPGRERRRLPVENTSRRVVRVSSHYPFERVNPRLVFDRGAATGFRLDVPAGSSVRWAPGEVREVGLVRYAGAGGDAAADRDQIPTADRSPDAVSGATGEGEAPA
jgi:urease subunit gamma/beta